MTTQTKIFKLIAQYRFKPSLRYYDFKTQIADKLFSQYRHWETDGQKVRLTDFKKSTRQALTIEHNQLTFECDIVESIGDFKGKLQQAFKEYTQAIKVENYLRFGIRSKSMTPVDVKFEELGHLIHEKLFSQDLRLKEITKGKVKDLMYNVVTESDGQITHTICGPVQKSEIFKWFSPVELTLSPGEKPEDIDFPEIALFTDCDFYFHNPKQTDLDDLLEKGLKQVTALPQELSELILGE